MPLSFAMHFALGVMFDARTFRPAHGDGVRVRVSAAVYPSPKGATLVQELIESEYEQIFQCTALVKRSGATVHATVRKLHQYPLRYGTMCYGQTESNEELLTESLKLLRALDYRGLGSLEFKYRVSDDSYYFIEMNTRLP